MNSNSTPRLENQNKTIAVSENKPSLNIKKNKYIFFYTFWLNIFYSQVPDMKQVIRVAKVKNLKLV